MPVVIPPMVTCEVAGTEVRVSGPGGKLAWTLPPGVTLAVRDGQAHAELDRNVRLKEREFSSRHGLVRSTVASMVTGVVKSYERKLEMRGQGYRPKVTGNKLELSLGFSKPVVVDIPAALKVVAVKIETGGRAEERYTITLSGADKILLGETAARIRRLRKADVYKGKGVRYQGENVRQKAGKATVAAGTGGK
jgi:large subunit ribosomal protein L6